jgi:hypothetical protein
LDRRWIFSFVAPSLREYLDMLADDARKGAA